MSHGLYKEHRMALVDDLALFISKTTYEDLSENARAQLKIRVLDALACAVGAMDGWGTRQTLL